MQRINAIDPHTATGTAKTLLDGVQRKLGFVPNLMRTFAVSPATLDAYLSFNDRLSHGILSPKVREQLALTVAYSNSCEYCLAAHTAIGGMLGLMPSQLEAAYTADSTDPRIAAALHCTSRSKSFRTRGTSATRTWPRFDRPDTATPNSPRSSDTWR